MIIDFTLNGSTRSVNITSAERASDVLIGKCGIKSIQADCMSGFCGRCMIIKDGLPVPSCLIPAFLLKGSSIITLESYRNNAIYEHLVIELDHMGILPCRHCRNAKLLYAMYLITRPGTVLLEDAVRELSSIPCACTDSRTLATRVIALRGGHPSGRMSHAHL